MKTQRHRLSAAALAAIAFLGTPAWAIGQTPQPTAPATQQGTQAGSQSTDWTQPWSVTGMAGVLSGSDLDGGAGSVGAALTYLDRGWLGAEATASFAPGVDLASPADRDASIGAYFVNALLSPRVELRGIRPFASIGLGLIHKAGVLQLTGNREEFDNSQFGINTGVGVMYFRGPWGIRSDIRYYMAAGEEDDDLEVLEPGDVLGDTTFWRWDIGVSYRWE